MADAWDGWTGIDPTCTACGVNPVRALEPFYWLGGKVYCRRCYLTHTKGEGHGPQEGSEEAPEEGLRSPGQSRPCPDCPLHNAKALRKYLCDIVADACATQLLKGGLAHALQAEGSEAPKEGMTS